MVGIINDTAFESERISQSNRNSRKIAYVTLFIFVFSISNTLYVFRGFSTDHEEATNMFYIVPKLKYRDIEPKYF